MEADVPPSHRSTTTAAALTVTVNVTGKLKNQVQKQFYSIFEVAPDFFDSCRLLESPSSTLPDALPVSPSGETAADVILEEEEEEERESKNNESVQRFSCNTCGRAAFESLQDQRFHFKSDFHRINIKLSVAGKDIVKEEDFDESTSDSLFKDFDISSISGSEDEDEDDRKSVLHRDVNRELGQSLKSKIFVQLKAGQKFSVWKCLFLDESEKISFEKDKSTTAWDDGKPSLTEKEVTEKLRYLIHEPRDKTHLRVLLLARGGHFAGCVFDGNSVVAHKTFHRYVIRAKAGKKQSSKDSSGKIAHSAGASIRRYNELALKKDIRELLSAWKPYFDAASCVFIHTPSDNRPLLFDGEKPYFSCLHCRVQNVPLTVRRPTLKEARRLYSILTQVCLEADEETATVDVTGSHSVGTHMVENLQGSSKEILVDDLDNRKSDEVTTDVKILEKLSISSESESDITTISTPLHEAAKSGTAENVLELLEQGHDPCVKDERGRTPYMLATDKEVRNTFRRFMASNLDKWDWQAAKVPSPLTKEMEESQAAKQAEKDAKRKARAKELKKSRKAKEKKAQAEAAQAGVSKTESSRPRELISKEEQLRRDQAAEREKRAAAAEKRLAALRNTPAPVSAPNSSQPNNGLSNDLKCSCCQSSLAGKVPFHRYNYKYCSTSCMHVHREMLEDE